MKIEKAFGPLLSNYEVLALLKEQETYQKTQSKLDPIATSNLLTVQFETLKFLNESPASVQTPDALQQYMEAMKDWKLTKAEKLQILNLRPKSAVELLILIEECEERFTVEQLEDILGIVEQTLPYYGAEEDAEMQDQEQPVEEETTEEQVVVDVV
ncbi:hypothetical protein H4R33_004323 [Dimargaris cristalligena]|uniref:DNA-directed RNA polymerase III subunit RPC9 n=1 Tax=Dimargaris cristalligena TaxID=215637 RepID=A0A4Q0A1B5_9FUNG|nr:hypothetical protein H4R33_004323 [Dimargaris cristalligena]RKP39855.1 HRDC-like protein [Dimargaris cristalligena]|eukprot:RKP39855.1 HRDC-like protein [Dimargaris cristalligena]